MVLDMKAILSHCRPLEVFQVEAIGFNNAIQVLGGWRPITTTSVKCKTKDASPTYLASLSLRSFVLRRAIFDQSSLEDVLEHTPYLEELHLIHLVPQSKLMNGYYLLFHMDIHDLCKYNCSNQAASR
ncbi:hypothetical protein BGZ97_004952 [Linnemannia gamsii]|uniref:Uncharacterized protein n=1 Tax=Linnemannia gamsii TaxID=64522 RepID=A0A9P6UGK0_9FUNG|nr:hypothetical protein BGZ97_004952 [Linnemannia gamsii]